MSPPWFEPHHPGPDLAPALACGWVAWPSGRHRLVPDACLDLLCVFDATGAGDPSATWSGRLLLCGPERRAWTFELPAGTRAVGVRFRPGWASLLFDLDVSQLVDRRIGLERVLGGAEAGRLLGELGDPGSLLERARRLEQAMLPLVATVEPGARAFVDDAIEQLVCSPRLSQQQLAARFGITPRQLHRRLQRTFGHGAAVLGRQLRFQRFLAVHELDVAGGRHRASIARLATDAGYADQAHLSRDCRAITGLTVRRFLDEWFPTFPDMSDPFKTSEPFVGTMGA